MSKALVWPIEFRFSLGVLLAGLALLDPDASAGPVDVRRDATVRAIERVMPSVVNISTERVVEIRDPFESFFRDFFNPYRQHRQRSLGSGVVIHEDGYVLTNFHVVRRATRIMVTLSDGREIEARLLTERVPSDVALLKLLGEAGEKFDAVQFARDDDLILGETVVALGNPFGLGGSVSKGILSSKTRRPPIENQPLNIQDWLQTDAAINPGNSGGPLINLRGELIGLNVAVFREAQGIGFAIPVTRLSEALGEIFTPEGVHSLWFGARFESSGNGLFTRAVEEGSPAERAGMRAGDRVLSVNGKTPKHLIELSGELIAAEEKREITFLLERDRAKETVRVRLIPEADFFNAAYVSGRLGADVQELTPELANALRLRTRTGLLIAAVEPDGPADQAGLQPRHVIEAIDRQPVQTVVDAARVLHGKKKGERVRLDLYLQRQQGRILQGMQAAAEATLR